MFGEFGAGYEPSTVGFFNATYQFSGTATKVVIAVSKFASSNFFVSLLNTTKASELDRLQRRKLNLSSYPIHKHTH